MNDCKIACVNPKNTKTSKVHPNDSVVKKKKKSRVLENKISSESNELELTENTSCLKNGNGEVVDEEDKFLINNFVDKNIDDQHSVRANEELQLEQLHRDRNTANIIEDDIIAYENEEAVLRDRFMDKNAVDDELLKQLQIEDSLLSGIGVQDPTFHANELDQEEEKLWKMLEEKESEEVVTGADLTDVEIESDNEDIVNAAMENELSLKQHEEQAWKIKESIKRTEHHQHQITRDVEDARLRDRFANAQQQANIENKEILRQHTRKNLFKVEDVRLQGNEYYRTQRGILEFKMIDSCHYTPSIVRHIQTNECIYENRVEGHTNSKDCIIDNQTLSVNICKTVAYVNEVDRIIDFDTFLDGTGAVTHLMNTDNKIFNVSRRHDISNEGIMDSPHISHNIPSDSAIINLKDHHLQIDSDYVNNVINHDLFTDGVRVQKINKFSISHVSETDVRNICRHFIPSTNSVVNRSKSFFIASQGEIIQQRKMYDLCEGGDIVQEGLRYDLCEGGDQDLQDRKYFVPLEGKQDENKPKYIMLEGSLINFSKSHFIPQTDEGLLPQNNLHFQSNDENFTPWKPNKFYISTDASACNEGSFAKASMDFELLSSETIFNIADDFDIDEEYLNQDEEDEDIS